MPRLRTTTFTALLACLLPLTSLAQDPRWYRVELLIFAHENAGAVSSELWPAQPELAYPEVYRFLRDPAREQANSARWPDADSVVDERGIQTITVPEPPPEDDGDPRLAAEDIPLVSAPVEPNAALEPVEEEPAAAATLPTAFMQRSAAELEFRGKAAFMQRSGRYVTLFHETWVQPVADRETALPLVIDRSGDEQDWPRLQGSVRLFLTRYLHLESSLWLNTDGSYLPGAWQMTPPPLGPASLLVIEPPPAAPQEQLLDAEAEAGPLLVEEAELETPTEEAVGPLYPWRHAVALAQSRRMRSNEVHYIDHPLLGLVVKLTPLSDEELLAMAEAEAAELQLQ